MRTNEEIEMLRRDNRVVYSLQDRKERSGVDRRYWDKEFGDIRWLPQLEPMAQACETFAADMVAGHTPKQEWRDCRPPLLIGPPGIGKTLLASLVCNVLMADRFFVRFVYFPLYVQLMVDRVELNRLMGYRPDDDLADRLAGIIEYEQDILTTAQFVVLDDVGKEHRTSSGFAGDTFDRIMRTRHRRGLPTMVTSNMLLDRWADTYSASMRSFVVEACEVIPLDLSGINAVDLDHRRARR